MTSNPDILIDPTKFKRGDVVRLNSGGPAMLIVRIALREGKTDMDCVCVWFDKQDNYKNSSFDGSWLTRVTP